MCTLQKKSVKEINKRRKDSVGMYQVSDMLVCDTHPANKSNRRSNKRKHVQCWNVSGTILVYRRYMRLGVFSEENEQRFKRSQQQEQ